MDTKISKPPFSVDTYTFSVSSIKEFEQCGKKFKLGRIDRIGRDPESTHHRWLGKAVHASIYSSIGKMNTAEGFKAWELGDGSVELENALKLFDAAWFGTEDKYLGEVIGLEMGDKPTGRFLRQKKKKSMDTNDQVVLEQEWYAESKKMLENGVSIISKLPKIVEIERKIEFEFEGHPFVGFVDLLAEDSSGKLIFLDFKTSWNRPSEKDVDGDLQFILYSVALRNLLGLDYYPSGYYVHLRSASVVRLDLDEGMVKKTQERVSKNFDRLERGLFYSSKGSPLCPYCDFYSHCYGEIKEWQ